MKNKLTLIISALLAVVLSVALCGCGKVDNNGTGGGNGHNHSYVKTEIDPTCTSDGYTLYTCACGDGYRCGTVPATGHTPKTVKEKEVPADCISGGSYKEVTYCSVCNFKLSTELVEVDRSEHDYKDGVCLTCGEAQDCNTEEFIFTPSDDGNSYTVSGFKGTPTKINIPYLYLGKPVTAIGASAFKECDTATSVIIPNSVTTIGSVAFMSCTKIKTVVIPHSLKTIAADSSFSTLNGLESIYYNGTVAEWCEIYKIHSLMGGLTSKKLYIGGEEVTDLIIPEGVTKIPREAFYGVSGITSVTVPSSLRVMEEDAFRFCKSLKTVCWNATDCREGWYNKMDNDFVAIESPFCDCLEFTDLIIGDSVEYIGKYLFYKNAIPSVTIPDSVTEIDEFAFEGCPNLTSLTIGKGVKKIGKLAFEECAALQTVYWNAEECEGGWVVDNTIYPIFHKCDNLTKAVFGNDVKSIPKYLFYKATSLQTVVVPATVGKVGYKAIDGCSGLQYVFCLGSTFNATREQGNTLFQVRMYYYSETEHQSSSTKYWHYDNNGNMAPW